MKITKWQLPSEGKRRTRRKSAHKAFLWNLLGLFWNFDEQFDEGYKYYSSSHCNFCSIFALRILWYIPYLLPVNIFIFFRLVFLGLRNPRWVTNDEVQTRGIFGGGNQTLHLKLCRDRRKNNIPNIQESRNLNRLPFHERFVERTTHQWIESPGWRTSDPCINSVHLICHFHGHD